MKKFLKRLFISIFMLVIVLIITAVCTQKVYPTYHQD
jgi:hypothetical protein